GALADRIDACRELIERLREGLPCRHRSALRDRVLRRGGGRLERAREFAQGVVDRRAAPDLAEKRIDLLVIGGERRGGARDRRLVGEVAVEDLIDAALHSAGLDATSPTRRRSR